MTVLGAVPPQVLPYILRCMHWPCDALDFICVLHRGQPALCVLYPPPSHTPPRPIAGFCTIEEKQPAGMACRTMYISRHAPCRRPPRRSMCSPPVASCWSPGPLHNPCMLSLRARVAPGGADLAQVARHWLRKTEEEKWEACQHCHLEMGGMLSLSPCPYYCCSCASSPVPPTSSFSPSCTTYHCRHPPCTMAYHCRRPSSVHPWSSPRLWPCKSGCIPAAL